MCLFACLRATEFTIIAAAAIIIIINSHNQIDTFFTVCVYTFFLSFSLFGLPQLNFPFLYVKKKFHPLWTHTQAQASTHTFTCQSDQIFWLTDRRLKIQSFFYHFHIGHLSSIKTAKLFASAFLLFFHSNRHTQAEESLYTNTKSNTSTFSFLPLFLIR